MLYVTFTNTVQTFRLQMFLNIWLILNNFTIKSGRIAKLVKRRIHRSKYTGFDPRLDYKRCSASATYSVSMWDNKDLLIFDSW
jgi:hypothetical protein